MAIISGAKCIKCKKFATHWNAKGIKYKGRRVCAECGRKISKTSKLKKR